MKCSDEYGLWIVIDANGEGTNSVGCASSEVVGGGVGGLGVASGGMLAKANS